MRQLTELEMAKIETVIAAHGAWYRKTLIKMLDGLAVPMIEDEVIVDYSDYKFAVMRKCFVPADVKILETTSASQPEIKQEMDR